MLEALTLKNFEGYKKAVLLFHEGVNVIVGESDHGKSSIMRALRWTVLNKPGGEEFISTWSEDGVSVKVRIDGKSVTRVKGKENAYYIDKKKYLSFGVGIPEDVSRLFNMEEVNIQNQLDTHFLLTDSPGEVARYFNKIVDLDIIDRSMSKIQQHLKSEKQGLLNKKSELASLEEELKSYDWLISAEDHLRKLEILSRSINATSTKVEQITSLLQNIEVVEKDKAPLLKLISAREEVIVLIGVLNNINKTKVQLEEITYLLDELEKIEKEKVVLSNLSKAGPTISSLMALAKGIGLKQTELLELSNIIESVNTIDSQIALKKKKKEELQKEIAKMMPDVCPLCDQEIRR